MLQKQKETKSDVLVKQNETGAKENSVSVTFPAKKYCSAAAGLPRQQQWNTADSPQQLTYPRGEKRSAFTDSETEEPLLLFD